MTSFSRRDFLLRSSASFFFALANNPQAQARKLLPAFTGADLDSGTGEITTWSRFGRLNLRRRGDSLILQDGFLISWKRWKDVDFSFEARAPKDADQVQIWAGIRSRDRDSRYVFGLRGGNNDDVYLARYAPDGGTRFLGIAPLDFHPEPGHWYSIRATAVENRIQIYLGQDKLPRINVEDAEALWQEGGISIGGGWLPVEFRNVRAFPLTAEGAASLSAIGEKTYTFGSFDAGQRRVRQRAEYKGLQVASTQSPRVEVSLNGDWLFLPDQEVQENQKPEAINCDDAKWHVMSVPNFWTPTLTWLHAETGFPNLEGVSKGKGLSDRLYQSELDRLAGYTFPWKETKSAWYRHHIELPENIANKHLELSFDAVAKVCEIWVNGIKVGAHIGMFGEVRCDITSAAKPGANVLAVHVQGRLGKEESSLEIVGIAVTVPVTASMLYSLPHGMYPEEASGIWQGVRLIMTSLVAVEEIFIEPRLDGLNFHLKVRNASAETREAAIDYCIRSVKDATIIYASSSQPAHTIEKTGAEFDFTTPALKPKLWSPHDPNLYLLEVTLTMNGEVVDHLSTRFGFRTFKVEGNKLSLNGKPLWLRGANHFPHALRPNDEALARRFMRMARDGNVIATRSHTAPFTSIWLNAADEEGVCVSYEGTWPWMMLEGDPPEDNLLRIWKDEFASLIRKSRNHPSLILWTVNNEMKFEVFDKKKPELLRKKWAILSDMVKTIRSIDPTRPVVCDSSYCRREIAAEYQDMILPSGFDDGDIDDAHRYYGWYDPTFYHLLDGEFGKQASWPDRPLISQEMSTGYPRNDDGHPTRFYLFKHYTPQALVGDDAYENRDPEIFLTRQAFMTKELAETIRRTNRSECAGVLHFAYVTWFCDAWSAEKIRPFATYHALRKALQPVLVSAELYSRHFYAGQNIRTRVCVVNDSENGEALVGCKLTWELYNGTKAFATGEMSVPDVPYYSNSWVDVSIHIPSALPRPRVDGSLRIRLEKEHRVLSSNDYDVTLATRAWAEEGLSDAAGVALLDPQGKAPAGLRSLGLKHASSVTQLNAGDKLVIAGAENVLAEPRLAQAIDTFAKAGGRVLLLNPGAMLAKRYPSLITHYRDCEGQIVSMCLPESRVFSGLEPLDLSWFDRSLGNIPIACGGVYQVKRGPEVACLASIVDIHGYLGQPEDVTRVSGIPLVQLHLGKGMVLASEMFLERPSSDPIAGRLLANLIQYLHEVPAVSET